MSRLVLIGFIICNTLLYGISFAGDHDKAYELLSSGKIMSLEKILNISHTYVRGHILEIELEQEDQQFIYEIEFLDKTGNAREIKLDATTGKIIQ